jgi:predicted AlkP superfamily phosphohydrolase/phosphomutase
MMRLFRRTPDRQRVAIIGLDCAEPSLLFGRFAGQLPTFDRLRQNGLYGRLESVIPAITVPAWSCMMSGQDPGALGIYGFRNRADYSYDGLKTSNSDAVRVPRLWDIASQHGRTSVVLNMPGTYPVRPLNGRMLACFLTPPDAETFAYPANFQADITHDLKDMPYPFDIRDFRTPDKAGLAEQISAMALTHFEIALAQAQKRDWDLFVTVEIGLDRMHHAFWRHMDETHRDFVPDSPYASAIFDYYRLLDGQIARLLRAFGDDVIVWIVSDHGARKMDGGIAINEWLLANGWLALDGPYPAENTRLTSDMIDWSRTQAWGEGGYFGRLFLNIRGREPHGIVAPEDAPRVLAEIGAVLAALGDEDGQPIGTRCFTPQDVYPVVNGIAPDLMIYFGDLAWRSIGTLGWQRVHVRENDTGPDDANHAQHGLFMLHDPRLPAGSRGREVHGTHLLQVAPTVLRQLGIEAPKTMAREPLT